MKNGISGNSGGTGRNIRGKVYRLGLIALLGFSSTGWSFNTAGYLPLTQGNTWAYQVNGINSTNSTVPFLVYTFNGVNTRAIANSGFDSSTAYFTNDANGIIQHAEFDPAVPVDEFENTVPATMTFSPGMKFAHADAVVGQSVATAGTTTFAFGPPYNITLPPVNFTSNSTITGFEMVVTPAGSFNTVKLVTILRIFGTLVGPGGSEPIDLTTTQTSWLARNIGLVKQESSDGISNDTALLTSYSVPALSFSSEVVKFGVQQPGTTSAPRLVILTSTGTVPVSSPFIFPPGGEFNMVENTCGPMVPVNTSCMVSFTFSPAVPGIRTGTANVTIANDYNMPQMINLIGGVTDKADFNADGKSDILWRENPSGLNAIWQMNGTTLAGSALIPSVSATGWTIAAQGDFDGDGYSDILWRNTDTGENAIWLMNGFALASSALIPSVPTSWSIAAVGDFNADGKADILWRDSTGQNAIWQMNGLTLTASALIPGVPAATPGWTIAGVGDFNADGKADILWRNTDTGDNAIWLMDGFTLASSALIPSVPTSWTIAGVGDFDGNGKADILWRDSTGQNAIWLMNGSALDSGALIPSVPTTWAIVGVGDYDGDGRADILWRESAGQNAIWLMNGASFTSADLIPGVPTSWSVVNTR